MVINKSQEKARNKVGFQALSHSPQSYFASPIYRVQRKRKFLTFFNSSLPKVTRFWISSGLCGRKGLKSCTDIDRSDAEISF